MIGLPAMNAGLALSVALGAFGVGIYLMMLVRMRSLDTVDLILIAVATFCLASAAMGGLGRGAGDELPMQGRYATAALMFWAAMIGLVWRMKRRTFAVLASAVLLIAAYSSGWATVAFLRDLSRTMDLATVELRSGAFPDEQMSKIYPFGNLDAIRFLSEFLRRERLSIFAN
jgi:hypothetical protein